MITKDSFRKYTPVFCFYADLLFWEFICPVLFSAPFCQSYSFAETICASLSIRIRIFDATQNRHHLKFFQNAIKARTTNHLISLFLNLDIQKCSVPGTIGKRLFFAISTD